MCDDKNCGQSSNQGRNGRVDCAVVLAAGLGTRMRPLTLSLPKPLVKVGGRSLIDRTLDLLEKTKVQKVVINLHHLGSQIRAHLVGNAQTMRCFDFVFSDESDVLLDSGGGVVKALPLLGREEFFILNSDTFWQEGAQVSNLLRLEEHFDADKMDMLLLTVNRQQAAFFERGDFLMDKAGRLTRARAFLERVDTGFSEKNALKQKSRADDEQAVIYAGALITHRDIFAKACVTPHSLNIYFDKAIEAGRLFGLSLKGHWYTVGTMAAIKAVEDMLALTDKLE